MKCKNTIAMVLAGAMLLPSNAFAADLGQTTTETYCRAHGITAIWARQSRWARSRARMAC